MFILLVLGDFVSVGLLSVVMYRHIDTSPCLMFLILNKSSDGGDDDDDDDLPL